ncbi:MAG TPA: AraC family transcriptional regulator ligand-binding domain-containing protein [Candidatus Acidoferrum sp.]|nr:AraC family transcriptional regulator ligand-binding domain-containing protein [Candidatus Acidoferrum sp.]
MQINAEWAGQTVAWLDRHRIATGPLLDKLRIDRRDLKYGRQIPAAHFAALLDFGAAQTRDACFGLRRGGEFRLKDGGVLAYLASCAETLGDALTYYQRYASIVCSGFAIELERGDGGVGLVLHVADPSWARSRHLSEFTAARTLSAWRAVTGTRLQPLAVQFTHVAAAPLAECRRLLGCGVAFGERADAIRLSAEALALRIPTADSRLGAILRSYADGLLKQVRAKGRDSLTDKAAAIIGQRLSSGEVSLRDVARRLHLSERTLRRRLREAGVTFSELVSRVRRDLADDWLRRTDFNVKHISYLLGYSDAAAFSRAYKRWTGRSPGAGGAGRTV